MRLHYTKKKQRKDILVCLMEFMVSVLSVLFFQQLMFGVKDCNPAIIRHPVMNTQKG
jgi:hypothetical protein